MSERVALPACPTNIFWGAMPTSRSRVGMFLAMFAARWLPAARVEFNPRIND
jgi:hypothetical protein